VFIYIAWLLGTGASLLYTLCKGEEKDEIKEMWNDCCNVDVIKQGKPHDAYDCSAFQVCHSNNTVVIILL